MRKTVSTVERELTDELGAEDIERLREIMTRIATPPVASATGARLITWTVRVLGIELLMPSLTVSENFKSPVVGGAVKLAVALVAF